jgi:hypothetical protein
VQMKLPTKKGRRPRDQRQSSLRLRCLRRIEPDRPLLESDPKRRVPL